MNKPPRASQGPYFETHRKVVPGVIFPQGTKICEECGQTTTNRTQEYQDWGYYSEIGLRDCRWFCSMGCVLTHGQKETGFDLLKNL
jgi:hypothetical protein